MFNKKALFRTYRWYYQWNLFWWKVEGLNCLNGINVYPPSDENSMGFVIKAGKWQLRFRWSKRANRFFWGFGE